MERIGQFLVTQWMQLYVTPSRTHQPDTLSSSLSSFKLGDDPREKPYRISLHCAFMHPEVLLCLINLRPQNNCVLRTLY